MAAFRKVCKSYCVAVEMLEWSWGLATAGVAVPQAVTHNKYNYRKVCKSYCVAVERLEWSWGLATAGVAVPQAVTHETKNDFLYIRSKTSISGQR